MMYVGIALATDFIKVVIAAWESNLACHPEILAMILPFKSMNKLVAFDISLQKKGQDTFFIYSQH